MRSHEITGLVFVVGATVLFLFSIQENQAVKDEGYSEELMKRHNNNNNNNADTPIQTINKESNPLKPTIRAERKPELAEAKTDIENDYKFDSATSTEQCLKNYEFLNKVRDAGTGNRKWPATALLLLGSYDYSDSVVVTLQSDGWYGKEVYCRYLSASQEEIGSPVKSTVFPEFAVHCCRRKGAAYMSITAAKNESIVQWVPLLDRTMKEPTYPLSLCLAPLYGNESKWLLLAETVEHYRLHGVRHFYIYVKDIDEYSNRLIESYVQSGEAEVMRLDHRQDRPGQEWQLVGVQDCLQRSRGHSKYAIFADLDERITPSSDISLYDFSKKIFENDTHIGAIQFRPRWILRDKRVPEKYEGLKTLDEHLPTKVFHNTSSWPPASHTSKCILDPTKVLIMWVHWAMEYNPGFTEYRVPPEQAVVRHYRDVAAGDWGQKWFEGTTKFGPYQNTDYPPKHLEQLKKNAEIRLDRVYAEKLT